MLDNNDYLRVGIDDFNWDESVECGVTLLLRTARSILNHGWLTQLPIKRPYMINVRHVEYIEGIWNEERSEYGIKIGYSSGATRCFWGSTARSVLKELASDGTALADEICKKFDDRVKAGPPTV